MLKIALSKNQIEALEALRKYPDAIVMNDGCLTGGVGVRLNIRTFESLKNKGLVERSGERRNRISELGKTVLY